MQRNCRQGDAAQAATAPAPPAPGRVFTLTRDQANQAPGTITGNLYIHGHPACVLFDTGATHSVISVTFAALLPEVSVPLDTILSISTPLRDSVRISQVYRGLPLQFDDRVRAVDALPLDMTDFDIILGMDWLSTHHATIDKIGRAHV